MSKITLPTTELKQALTGLAKVASRKNDGTPQSHIKVERTHDGWVTLSACDRNSIVSVRLEQPSYGDPSSVVVPLEELQRPLRVCGRNECLELETLPDNSTLLRYQIAGEWAQQSLPVNLTERFPTAPTLDSLQIPIPEHLRVAIGEGLSCASADHTRTVLNGLFVDVSKPFCHTLVGSDGKHLYASNSFSLPLKDSFILPKSSFLGWREFSKDGEWKLRVSSASESEKWCELTSRRWTVRTKAVEGVYPNWRQIMPKASEVTSSVEMDPGQVDLFLRTIEKMPCPDTVNHRIGLQLENGRFFLFVKTQGGQPQLRVEVQGALVTGADIEIQLNRQFLCKALEFGLIRMEFVDGLSPVRFVDGGKQMLVMPIRSDSRQVSQGPSEPTEASKDDGTEDEDDKLEHDQAEAPPPSEESTEASQPSPVIEQAPMTDSEKAHAPECKGKPEQSALQKAITKVESLKVALSRTNSELDTVLESLHLAEREQESKEREIEHVRVTLHALQNVRI